MPPWLTCPGLASADMICFTKHHTRVMTMMGRLTKCSLQIVDLNTVLVFGGLVSVNLVAWV
jgi:hypothetical protein